MTGARRQLDLLLVAFGVPLVALYSRVNLDDPFITFRYAWNFAAGNGLVFNVGERVLGTTSPFFAILLGMLSHKVEVIPLIAHGISGAALIMMALLISRVVGEISGIYSNKAGAIAALFVLTSPLLAQTQGFELNLYLVFALAGIRFGTRERMGWAGICLAVAALFRADAFIPAALIGLRTLRSERGDWCRFGFGFGVPIVIFATASWSYYGYPLPNTLAAKQAMGESGLWRGYLRGGVRLAGLYVTQSPIYLTLVPVALLGLKQWIQGSRDLAFTFIILWTSIVFVIYSAMGIPSAFNYYGMFVPVIATLIGLGTRELLERFRGNCWVVPVVVVLMGASQLWPSRAVLADVPSPRYVAYREAAEHLRRLVAPEETVAVVEIGIVSHFSKVRILDLVGLVHPEIGPHLAEGDVTWPVREWKPEFILLHDPPWPSIETRLVEAEWFSSEYQVKQTFSGPDPYGLVLYSRN